MALTQVASPAAERLRVHNNTEATTDEEAAEATSSGRSCAAGPQRRGASSIQEAPQDNERDVPVLMCDWTMNRWDACQGCAIELVVNRYKGCMDCGWSGHAERDCKGCHGAGKALQDRIVCTPSFGKALHYTPDCHVCLGKQALAETCQVCGGAGRVLETTIVTVEVEPGAETGKVLCLRGQGDAGVRGDQRGDLNVRICVMESHEAPAHVDDPVGEQLRVRVTSPITHVQSAQCARAQQWPPRPVPAPMRARDGRL